MVTVMYGYVWLYMVTSGAHDGKKGVLLLTIMCSWLRMVMYDLINLYLHEFLSQLNFFTPSIKILLC